MIYGYARVSTTEQDTNLQIDALKKAGAQVIYQEKRSGADRNRPELKKLLARMQSGDTLIVYKLDRLGRSIRHIMDLMDTFSARNIGFRSLTEPFDTTSALGELFLHIMAAFAQFERSLIRERSIAGQQAAIARGAKVGRPCTVPSERLNDIEKMLNLGYTQTDIARRLEVSISALRRFMIKHKLPFLKKRCF